MRSLSLGVLCLAVLLGGSCKPLHDREGLDPVSEPEYAVSDGGTMLTAIKGKQRGICIIRSLLNYPKSAQLVTERGALSDKQIKSALGYMGWGESIAAAIVAAAIGGGVVLAGRPPRATDDLLDAEIAGWLVALTAMGAYLGYGTARAKIGSEKWGDIFRGNTDRLRKLLSSKEEWQVTDEKMNKLLKKLGDIYPEYPGQCDHIETDLQRSSNHSSEL